LGARLLSFPKVAEGSEHQVYLDAEYARVWKVTKPGLFGENYFIENGKIAQKNCTPLDYLIRLRLWSMVFGTAPRAVGMTDHGQIVSVHSFIQGQLPSQSEVNSFLVEAGFTPLRQKYWLWEKAFPKLGFTVGLGDARDENFVRIYHHIVPIDVRLWRTV